MPEHTELAWEIIGFGAPAALGEHMADAKADEWKAAAQAYIDTNGDDTGLSDMLEEIDLFEQYRSQAIFYQENHGGDYMDFDQWKDAQ